MINRLRLTTGLVLFTYALGHLLNHAMGIASVRLMNQAQAVLLAPWQTLPGTFLLAGAALIHVAIALRSLYVRRNFRLKPWEAAQLILGLCIPFLLMDHVMGTAFATRALAANQDYWSVLVALWVVTPWEAALQGLALLVVWIHGCIGVRSWLRLRPAYPRLAPALGAGAVMLPTLALAGYVSAGLRAREEYGDPDFAALILEDANLTADVTARIDAATGIGLGAALGLLAAVLTARALRTLFARHLGVVRLTYGGVRVLPVKPGATVLEALRDAGIPHASVCGGRGRCSTCRVSVAKGLEDLPPPSEAERRVLARIGAPATVRLACQIRPTRDLAVTPLLPATATAADSYPLRPVSRRGEERDIAVLFADLRGFTRLADGKLPYDVVFVLNHYFAAMGHAIERAGGHVDKFLGDGVMALFGITAGPEAGCRQAVAAAADMLVQLDLLNAALSGELREPLAMGIGLHSGPAIVGEMGFGQAKGLTAIGDVVNTASRLESLTKDLAVPVILSETVAARAGLERTGFVAREVVLRGKAEPLAVWLVAAADALRPPPPPDRR